MRDKTRAFLEEKARIIRYLTVEEIGHLGVGHIGGCLSIADLLAVLYFDAMRTDPSAPQMPDRDRLVLSKGHAGPALYATLAERGFFSRDTLLTLNQLGTSLPSHCDMVRTKGIDMTAGSLGQGISCAVGMALGARLHGYKDTTIYAILGDGESQEGQVWEASMAAAQYKLDNLVVFLDNNGYQIDGTVNEVMSLIDPAAKWQAFGFFVQTVNGHEVGQLQDAIARAKAEKERPSMIVMNTVKGKGVSFVETAGAANHNMTLSREQTQAALAELA